VAFTYSDTLATDCDRVRFAIGDTVSASGPKPADANFTDAELAGLVTIEGTWQRATAAAFEVLASLWAKHPTFEADGVRASQSDIAKQYRESALEWRKRFGTSGTMSCGSTAVIRQDGYSSDLDSVTV
jgi:hypothetical protein